MCTAVGPNMSSEIPALLQLLPAEHGEVHSLSTVSVFTTFDTVGASKSGKAEAYAGWE